LVWKYLKPCFQNLKNSFGGSFGQITIPAQFLVSAQPALFVFSSFPASGRPKPPRPFGPAPAHPIGITMNGGSSHMRSLPQIVHVTTGEGVSTNGAMHRWEASRQTVVFSQPDGHYVIQDYPKFRFG
jgi:hypothetical protein